MVRRRAQLSNEDRGIDGASKDKAARAGERLENEKNRGHQGEAYEAEEDGEGRRA